MIVGLFILGLCIWVAGLFTFIAFFCDSDDDEGEIIILSICLLVFGGLIMHEAKDPDAIANHIRHEIDRVNHRINEAKVDCKELNITEEQCDVTFLYKLKREKADLEVQLKEKIMEKYKD
jgi:hypothetical protein